jgi:DNA-binding transcriptional ArsR family regulator
MRTKKVFGSISEEKRQRILEKLREAYPCDLCVKEVAKKVGISTPTASTYLKVLVASGEIEISRRFGKLAFYRLKKLKKEEG